MNNVSQEKQILKYLKTHKKGITPLDALRLFGCMRLSGRIFNLREEGHDIRTEIETVEYEDGSKKCFARYYLYG